MNSAVLKGNTNCGTVQSRPDAGYINTQDARENPPVFLRRALKIVEGQSVSLGTSCGTVACGITIASENPVYVQGDSTLLRTVRGAVAASRQPSPEFGDVAL